MSPCSPNIYVMKRKDAGSIINLSFIVGSHPLYASTKCAIETLTSGLALQLAD
jgi:NAD(P)-dependent dehydrogenase (short-subunit alcohol dehydrogenase family)